MLILSIVLLVIGMLVFILALRGRMVERGSFCRRCRFDLAGLPTEPPASKCPECGADIAVPRATRPDLRRRRPIVLTLGIVLLLSGLTLMGIVASNNTAKIMAPLPDRVVLTLHALGMDAAFTEIATNRLAQTKPLSDETWDELIADAIAHQKDINTIWDPRHGEVLLRAFMTGRMNDEQIEQYFELGYTNSVEFPDEVRYGAKEVGVSVVRSTGGRISALSGNFGQLTDPVDAVWNRIEITAVGLVEPECTSEMDSAGWTGLSIPGPSSGGGRGSIGATIKMDGFNWSKVEPGKEYAFFVEYEIRVARMSDDYVHYRTQQRVTRPVKILPQDAELVALDTHPDTIALFRDRMAIRLSPLRIIPKAQRKRPRANPYSIDIGVMAANLPVAVVGHVFVIHGGKEYLVGEASMTSIGSYQISGINQSNTTAIDDSILQQWLDAGQVIIEIRPDPRLAEKTPGVDRILGVPVRFAPVPVTEEDISNLNTIGRSLNPKHVVGQPVTDPTDDPPPTSEPAADD